MTKLRVGRGIDHHRAAALMPPRWLRVFPRLWRALGGLPTGSLVRYGLTGSVAGGPKTRVQGRGRTTATGPGGSAAPWGASAVPLPVFPPVEPTPAASVEPRQHSHPCAPATRTREYSCHTPRSNPLTPEPPTAAHRNDHGHEPGRCPAALSNPPDSRQRATNLGHRATSFSPPDALPAPLPQTPPCTSASRNPHRSAAPAESVMTSSFERRSAATARVVGSPNSGIPST